MIDPQAVAYARLTGDATLAAMLATYGSGRAVFEDGKTPPEFAFGTAPAVLVGAPAHQGNDDSFDADMRLEQLIVRLYHRPDGSSLPLHTAAERVRALFNKWGPAAITGGTMINATVSGPVPAPTEDPTLDGRLMYLTLLIKET